ncbi:hypothetical protein INR49_002200 [Caranx melampygus]|nr:hypothetical protein INR49_002200 [Caranx melampygus]
MARLWLIHIKRLLERFESQLPVADGITWSDPDDPVVCDEPEQNTRSIHVHVTVHEPAALPGTCGGGGVQGMHICEDAVKRLKTAGVDFLPRQIPAELHKKNKFQFGE